MISIEAASEIIDEYNYQEHIRGTVDCNLLFMKLHEPEMYEKFHGRYKTITGGIRVGRKLFGFSSIKEVLENGNYDIIDPNFQQPLDIIAFHNRHDIYVSLGNMWFGVDENNHFSIVSKVGYNSTDFTVYRKGK